MFRVQNTILSEDIATVKFACNLPKCKGACCVVGDAGAPVSDEEIPKLENAFHEVKEELRPKARQKVREEGLIRDLPKGGNELACTDGEECVFITYDEDGVAKCAIQKAFLEGRLEWEKPVSCHLFPMRLKRIAGFDYANFEYFPRLCAAACRKGEKDETYLSDFLKDALVRRYSEDWYKEFENACEEIRNKKSEPVYA